MPSRSLILPLAAAAGIALFFYAVIHIMLLRYDRGDLYPPYSTLRTDPLGARVLYEALGDAGGYHPSRGFVPLHRELETKPATILFLGFGPSGALGEFEQSEITELNDFVQNGGHAVITFSPVDAKESDEESKDKKKEADKKIAEAKKETKHADQAPPKPVEKSPDVPKTAQEKYERDEFRRVQDDEKKIAPQSHFTEKFKPSLLAVWGVGLSDQMTPEEKKKEDQAKPESGSSAQTEYDSAGDVVAERAASDGTEEKVPWKSSIHFIRLEPQWQVRYKAKDKPVLISRSWGQGEIIVASDSYFVSNEALRSDRRPLLLGVIAGPRGGVLFDEVHLGTQEQEGVMVLAQRFRLVGYLYGLLIVAALFLWRNSVPLVPPRLNPNPTEIGGAVSGKDSRSGLVNLLRRNIGPRDILKTCLAEWKRTAHADRRAIDPKTAAMESLLTSTDVTKPEQIVGAYHQLREINTGRRTQEPYATKP